MTDLHGWITQQVDHVEQLIGENEWPPSQTDAAATCTTSSTTSIGERPRSRA